jgi:hypothetical protein
MKRKIYLLITLITLSISFIPLAYSWDSNPKITWQEDSSGNTILTIVFDFSQMSNPPTSTHYPIEFQVRISDDGKTWKEFNPVQISPRPTTTIFNISYNLGKVVGTPQIQVRLKCSIHGWSTWQPFHQ